jgi:3-hydroxybutyryl-CoA dehydrogenase
VTGDLLKPCAAPVFTIAIVGAADLGRTIAQDVALAGFRTILEDISSSVLEQGIAWIRDSLGAKVSRGSMDAATRDTALANLHTANSVEDVCRETDLIIEAVADEEEMKLELFTIFDKFAKPGAVLASTTRSLPITDLAKITFCQDRCIGMHFFEDKSGARRLELIRGRATSEETIAACYEMGQRMGREVSVRTEEQLRSAGA